MAMFRKYPISGLASLFLATLIITIAGVLPARAQQANDYHLYGKVTDTKGNPIPGAVITLREKNGWKEIKIVTDKNGRYDRWFIPHNVYEIKVEKEGYITKKGLWNLSRYEDQPIEKEINIVLVSEKEMQEYELGKKIKKNYEEAFKALQKNDCKNAVKKANAVVKDAPDFFGGYFILGRCEIQAGHVDKAIQYYQKALSIKSDIPEAHLDLGNLYAQKQDLDAALQEYQKVLELKPDNVDALYSIGAIYYNRKEWDKAIENLKKVVDLNPEHVQALRVLGYACAQKGDFKLAADFFKRYLELKPNAEDRKAAEDIIKVAESMNSSG